ILLRQKQKKLIMLLSETMIWQPEFTDKILSRNPGAVQTAAVARKLFNIHEDGRSKILVRFITEGKQTELRGKATKGGYTVWKMKSGHPTPIYVADLDKAVRECLK
ncbi:hypothetical protein ACLEVE_23795, partial [Escherichia coli]